MEVKIIDGKWSAPYITEFSGEYSDADPSLSSNGDRLFFISDRYSKDLYSTTNYDIWYVEKLNGNYINPKRLGKKIK